MAFLTFLFLSISWAQSLPSEALLLVHPSRHYHTSQETIVETNNLVKSFSQQGLKVIALAQNDIKTDPLWYSFREWPLISEQVISRMGEHSLKLVSRSSSVRATIVGGYHSSCLGQAMAELVARFISDPKLKELEIVLPMQAIFTGFLWQGNKLVPSVEFESYADSSIDGLNLYQVTRSLDENEWQNFIWESLQWGFFKKGPIVRSDLHNVSFSVMKNGRPVIGNSKSLPGKTVRFNYVYQLQHAN